MRHLLLLALAAALGWAMLGCLLGWDRWLDVPSKWSWQSHADWPAQAAFAALLLLSFLLLGCLALPSSSGLHAAPLDRAGLLSRYTFWWVMPTLQRCLKHGKLDLADLPQLSLNDSPHKLYERFAAVWARQQGKGRGWRHWRLFVVVMFSIQRPVILQSLLTGWLFLGAMFVDPILLGALLKEKDASLTHHLGLVAFLAANMLLRVTCMELCYFHSVRVANNARAVLCMAVFRSSMAKRSVAPEDVGPLTNLMATDADKFGMYEWFTFNLAQWTFSVVSLPFIILVMHEQLGSAAYIGLVAYVLSNAAASFVWKIQMPIVRKLQERRDARARLMSELIRGIRLVKAHSCEAVWGGRLEEARRHELREIVKLRYLDALTSLICGLLTQAAPLSIFSWYITVEGHSLDAAAAFTTLAWIQQINWTISSLPNAFNALGTLLPSLKRLDAAIATIDSTSSEPHLGGASSTAYAPPHTGCVSPTATAPSINGVASINALTDAEIGAPRRLFPRGPLGARRAASLAAAPLLAPQEGEAASDTRLGTHAVVLHECRLAGVYAADEAEAEGEGRQAYGVVSFEVARGECLLVCGAVGAGKSTFLAALASARPPVSGAVASTRSRAYVPQKPFLMQGTIRENILFGLSAETFGGGEEELERRYQEAIRLSCLGPDLKEMKVGELTRVGEGGLCLSGGQKARVALARALCAHAEAVFLDDIFAACDAHTGELLWEGAVCHLLSRGAAVVLATHQLQFCGRPQVDRVAVIQGGAVAACGPWEKVQHEVPASMLPQAFSPQSAAVGIPAGDGRKSDAAFGEADASHGAIPDEAECGREDSISLEACARLIRSTLQFSEGKRIDTKLIDEACHAVLRGTPSVEAKREGMISAVDFGVYLRNFGTPIAFVTLILVTVFSSLFSVADSIWLAHWTGSGADSNTSGVSNTLHAIAGSNHSATNAYRLVATPPADSGSQTRNLLIYVSIGCTSELFGAMQTIALTLCALRASRRVHSMVLSRVLAAPMLFFDSTPSGGVLNRFLSDMQNLDNAVPDSLVTLATQVLTMVTQLGLVLFFAPWVAFALPFLLLAYNSVYQRVRPAARDTRRIGAVAHTPVFSHFGDALAGRETIAAFGAEQRFSRANERLVDDMSRAQISNQAVQKWAQVLTVQSGSLLYGICGATCVLLLQTGQMNLSELGLVLLNASTLQRAVMDMMMQLTSIETEFVSVERLAEYTRLQQEIDHENAQQAVDPGGRGSSSLPCRHAAPALRAADTSSLGAIAFRHVFMRYRIHLPPVLSDISLQIAAGSKVALCGRTGSGKSSLLSVLCRLYPIDRGAVYVDGINWGQAPLQFVRRAVRVVAQDALLLEGTLLSNLQAFSLELNELQGKNGTDSTSPLVTNSVDASLLRKLELVGLRNRVEALPLGLQTPVRDADFSDGERQLFSLCRGLVSDGQQPLRVLLCDEPTSNVDLHSDNLVHAALLSLDCTVVVIAHRLQQTQHFDKVIVMSNGTILESGSPAALLEDQGSAYSHLCHRAGLK